MKDKTGGTPLHWEAENGNAEVISALVEAGAEVNAKDNGGKTPLDKAKELNDKDTVSALKKAGAK